MRKAHKKGREVLEKLSELTLPQLCPSLWVCVELRQLQWEWD